MIGTLIPQTRELLQHVRKLSQLAGADDASARARSRRARRSLKVPASSCNFVCCRAFSSAVHSSSLQRGAARKIFARAMLAELCLRLLVWVHHAGLLDPFGGLQTKVSFSIGCLDSYHAITLESLCVQSCSGVRKSWMLAGAA